MNDSRRAFLKKAALLSGSAGLWNILPASIEKALAIAPDPGTTFYDAEHVVLLMQENRSFDHCFGTLKGVRGFNDPRAITLPGKLPVWLQPDKEGNRFAPFRLDIQNTKASWMGDLPHSWENQVDARNQGKYDGWIEAKRSGKDNFNKMPLTMGYYNREDIPFYYALADSFTVCDQHFCASLTGTTTNRNYFWSGTTHHGPGDKPKVRNGEMGYENEVSWATFPERLEDHDVSWKVYQNEINLPTNVEDSSLLAGFTDNNLEWFSQYKVRFSKGYQEYLLTQQGDLMEKIKQLELQLSGATGNAEATSSLKIDLKTVKENLKQVTSELDQWDPAKFQALDARTRKMHQQAFSTNMGDPDYHQISEITFEDQGQSRTTQVPKGDILHQFRKDVEEGQLPTVSWVVAPQKFSDHPSAPWYGAWYVSEVMDILTKNPEVWKKTIFILNYDENDGYFDHVPPFVAPNPLDPENGKMSEGLDVTGEFVTREEEFKAGFSEQDARTSPVGLGYRVPLVIASPWSKGGWVNSEVCDITSTIQFLEKFLSHKTGKKVAEPNISSWRRAMSGDLTSVFRPYKGEAIEYPEWVNRNQHVERIYNASFKEVPSNYQAITESDARAFMDQGATLPVSLPQQEPGTKYSNALKYELYTDARLSDDKKHLVVRFTCGQEIFGQEALGAPFNVYAPGNYWNDITQSFEPVRAWTFAVKSGDTFEYHWPLKAFEDETFHLQIYGPNGYFRDVKGDRNAHIEVNCKPVMKAGKPAQELQVEVMNQTETSIKIELRQQNYQAIQEAMVVPAQETRKFNVPTAQSQGWYDFVVQEKGKHNFTHRFAGRLETGQDSITDPVMGQVV